MAGDLYDDELGISFFPGRIGRRGEAPGTYPALVFRGLDQPSRHVTPSAAASASLSLSVYPLWDGNQPKPAHTSGVERKGWVGRVRPPVVLLRSVVRERVGAEMIQQRGRPSGEFQRVETPPDVMEDRTARPPAGIR